MPVSQRRRHAAARRLEPLDGRCGPDLGSRDPLATWPTRRGPSTFSLTPDERRHYASALVAGGWQRWEIVATLAPPETVAAA